MLYFFVVTIYLENKILTWITPIESKRSKKAVRVITSKTLAEKVLNEVSVYKC